MKKRLARFVLISGVDNGVLACVFIFASPGVSILLNYPLTPLSGTTLQIIAAFLVKFSFALVIASRNLNQLLIIPVADILARLIAFIIVFYYVLVWELPSPLLLIGVIEAVFGAGFILFILLIKATPSDTF